MPWSSAARSLRFAHGCYERRRRPAATTLLATAAHIAQEAASRIKRNEAGAGAADEAGGAAAASVPTARSDRFQLVYTCGMCETRNLISVSRVSWTSGVVIATCHGCGRRHLLADNTGLLDTTNSTGFSNVEDLLAQRGEAVTRVSSLDDETLSEFFVQKKSDGAGGGAEVELMPQPASSSSGARATARSWRRARAPSPRAAPVYTPTTRGAVRQRRRAAGRANVTVTTRYDDLAKGSAAADGERGVVVAPRRGRGRGRRGRRAPGHDQVRLLQVPVPETFAALRHAAADGPAARLQPRVERARVTLPEGALAADGETIESSRRPGPHAAREHAARRDRGLDRHGRPRHSPSGRPTPTSPITTMPRRRDTAGRSDPTGAVMPATTRATFDAPYGPLRSSKDHKATPDRCPLPATAS